MVRYVRTHALMYEYYRQAQEIVPPHIGKVLHNLFNSEAFQIVNTRLAMHLSYNYHYEFVLTQKNYIEVFRLCIRLVLLKFWQRWKFFRTAPKELGILKCQ